MGTEFPRRYRAMWVDELPQPDIPDIVEPRRTGWALSAAQMRGAIWVALEAALEVAVREWAWL